MLGKKKAFKLSRTHLAMKKICREHRLHISQNKPFLNLLDHWHGCNVLHTDVCSVSEPEEAGNSFMRLSSLIRTVYVPED